MSVVEEIILSQKEKITDENRKSGRYGFDFGFGEGMNLILNGYISFGQYQIQQRHIPNLEDGLKPVQRRIVKSLYDYDKGKTGSNYVKSAKITADTMNKYHPHGDGSIYGAMVRMTQVNGSSKVDLVDGHGGHGDLFSSSKPASQRYTLVRSGKNLIKMFDSPNGVEEVQSKADENRTIYRVLPTKYPYALVGMAQEGTAVGLATTTVIYDVEDIANMIIKYVNTGKLDDVIAPDFVTGGYIVQNTKEFTKLMKIGKCRVKVRGTVELRGRDIYLRNLPSGIKVERLIKEINELDLKGVKVHNGTSKGDRGVVKVTCSSTAYAKEVLNTIYIKTSFQKYYNVSTRFLFEDKLVSIGLWDCIRNWVSFRKEVLEKEYSIQLDALKSDLAKYQPLISLLQDTEAHKQFMKIFGDIDRDESEARDFLIEFGITNRDALEFILSRTMRALRNGGKYFNTYNSILAQIQEYEEKLSDIGKVIASDMEDMKRDWGHYKRCATVTTEDIIKVDRQDIPVETTVMFENGYISRVDGEISESSKEANPNRYYLETRTDKTIVLGLANGTLLTLRVKNIPYGYPNVGELVTAVKGTKVDALFFEEAQEGKELYFYYSTGHLSFLDLTPFTKGTNIAKERQNFLPTKYLPYLQDIGVWDEEASERISVQISNFKCGWVSWGDVKHKAPNSVSRLFNPSNEYILLNGQPEEFAGLWFMNEKYHRPRPINIKLADRGDWTLAGYLDELRTQVQEDEAAFTE